MQWSRKKVVVTTSLIVLFASVIAGCSSSSSSDDTGANRTDPGVNLTPGIGTNANNKGKKFLFVEMQDIASGADVTIVPTGTPMVVNFWYSTCAPCIRELPALSDAAEKYGDKVQFIGVNPNDSRDVAQAFLKNLGVNFASYIDDGDQLSAVEVATFPTTYFLNANGVIVKMQSGELKQEDIESILKNDLGVAG
jgi:thiol-disulfide isomerase/thioredoxin